MKRLFAEEAQAFQRPSFMSSPCVSAKETVIWEKTRRIQLNQVLEQCIVVNFSRQEINSRTLNH